MHELSFVGKVFIKQPDGLMDIPKLTTGAISSRETVLVKSVEPRRVCGVTSIPRPA